MRLLLLENDLEFGKEQLRDFQLMDANQKIAFAKKYLKALPNYKYLQKNEYNYIENIVKNGLDERKNPYLTYIKNNRINFNYDDPIQKLIKTLIMNKHLPADAKFLNDKNLYLEPEEDTAYKIKLITFASNPNNKNKYNVEINAKQLRNNNGWMTADEMRDVFNTWVTTSEKLDNNLNSEDKTSLDYKLKHKQATGEDILRAALPTYNEKNIREYIKNLFPESTKTLDKFREELLDSGDLDDEIDAALSTKIYSSMGKDINNLLDQKLINTVKIATDKIINQGN